jgi:hypothetical protein
MTVQTLSAAEARRILLPSQATGFVVALFVERRDESPETVEKFEAAVDGIGLRVGVVETLGEAAEVAEWFRIRDLPTVAIVYRGMLLGLANECTSGACRRAIRDALDQFRMLHAHDA